MPGMENGDQTGGRPGLGRRIWNGYHKRELAAVRWLLHEIKTREDAERAVQYGQSAAFYAILIRVVFVLFPGNTEDMVIEDYSVLVTPVMLAAYAFYGFIYFKGFEKWQLTLLCLVVFVIDSVVLPRETGGGTLVQVLLCLYVVRCFVIGIRGGRRLAKERAAA